MCGDEQSKLQVEHKSTNRSSPRHQQQSYLNQIQTNQARIKIGIELIGPESTKPLEVGSEDDNRKQILVVTKLNGDSDDSAEECCSTEGEETDLESPQQPNGQYLNQSSDLRAALINSQALIGDYVELKNCKRCGSMIFKDQSASIKPDSHSFNADISPAQLLTKMFQDEANYKFDHFINFQEIDNAKNKLAKSYFDQRDKLVTMIIEMGTKFKQREKTQHIAIELLDRYFLDRKNQQDKSATQISQKTMTIFVSTCFMVASKYDEIDDQLVFINDIQNYYKKLSSSQSFGVVPTYQEIVDCERQLLQFFEWDLGFVMPYHFVEMFLANGILFESEFNQNIKKEKQTAEKISKKCYEILKDMIKQKNCFKNQGYSGNQVASMIVYTARQEVLNLTRASQIWPKELQLISRQTDKQVKILARKFRAGNRIHRTEPFEDNPTIYEQHLFQNQHGPSQYQSKYNNASLQSPKPTQFAKDNLVSSEKISVDIPLAQIIIPEQRQNYKQLNFIKSKEQSSQTKSHASVFKVENQNHDALHLNNSLETTKVAPFRTKKLSLERVGLNSSSQLQKYSKLPFSHQKKNQNGIHLVDRSNHKLSLSNKKPNDNFSKFQEDRKILNSSKQICKNQEIGSQILQLRISNSNQSSSALNQRQTSVKSNNKKNYNKLIYNAQNQDSQHSGSKSKRQYYRSSHANQIIQNMQTLQDQTNINQRNPNASEQQLHTQPNYRNDSIQNLTKQAVIPGQFTSQLQSKYGQAAEKQQNVKKDLQILNQNCDIKLKPVVYKSNIEVSKDVQQPASSSLTGLTSQFWQRNHSQIGTTMSNNTVNKTYINQSVDKYSLGRPNGRQRGYRGASTRKECYSGLQHLKNEQQLPGDADLFKQQEIKRDTSRLAHQIRIRERQSSTVLSQNNMKNCLSITKPNSGRQTLVCRSRDKQRVGVAQIEHETGHKNRQQAQKRVLDIKDLRDAKSAAEVRLIMNEVKSRYKNTGLTYNHSGQIIKDQANQYQLNKQNQHYHQKPMHSLTQGLSIQSGPKNL